MPEQAYECGLTLSVDGYLRLRTPQGRELDFPPNEHSLKLLIKVLKEAKSGWTRDAMPKGYIRSFPTQHVIDSWLRQKRDEDAKKPVNGFDLSKLDIKL